MATRQARKIVKIDPDKCNGCGLCVPSCAEGAIKIIDGKARLAADNLCDGLGNCLGHCPMDAITIEERPADDFDENAVEQHLASHEKPVPAVRAAHAHGGGCPGTMFRKLAAQTPVHRAPDAKPAVSRLGQWPVQLALVPVTGQLWQGADVLIAADCVAFAMGDFHERLLAGKAVAIACPKLDDIEPYIEKLTAIFANNDIKSITVAHMEVPCCNGIVVAARVALQRSGRTGLEINDITVGIDGNIQSDRGW